MYPGHRINPLVLLPYNGDTFLDTETKTGVHFTVGSSGTATGVRFDQFEKPGRNGTFVRSSP